MDNVYEQFIGLARILNGKLIRVTLFKRFWMNQLGKWTQIKSQNKINSRDQTVIHLPYSIIVNCYHVHSIFSGFFNRRFLDQLYSLFVVAGWVMFGFTNGNISEKDKRKKKRPEQKCCYPKNTVEVMSPVSFAKCFVVCLVPIGSNTKTSSNIPLVKLMPLAHMFAYRLFHL